VCDKQLVIEGDDISTEDLSRIFVETIITIDMMERIDITSYTVPSIKEEWSREIRYIADFIFAIARE
jgi:hypothetical protein